jgi:hypothetical protein
MDARDFLQTKTGNATWLNEFLAGYRGYPPPSPLLAKWFALYGSVFKDINSATSVTLHKCFIIAFLPHYLCV